MEWQEVAHLKLTKDWQYTSQIRGRDFKVTYLTSPLLGVNSAGIIALVDMPTNSAFESTEIFKPQRITSYSISEIIRFPEPPKNWACRLGIKQLIFAKNTIPNCEVKIYMPVIDLTPDQPVISPTIATAKTPTSVSIAGTSTAAVKLLPVNATNSRKHATFYNPSTKRNLYIDTDGTINVNSAIAKVAPGKVYISDIPGWQGEYWGMMDLSDTVAAAIAIEEYV